MRTQKTQALARAALAARDITEIEGNLASAEASDSGALRAEVVHIAGECRTTLAAARAAGTVNQYLLGALHNLREASGWVNAGAASRQRAWLYQAVHLNGAASVQVSVAALESARRTYTGSRGTGTKAEAIRRALAANPALTSGQIAMRVDADPRNVRRALQKLRHTDP